MQSGIRLDHAGLRSFRARNTALFSYFVLGGGGFGVWVARLPSIRDDLGVSIAELGILSFALPAGSLVGIALASPLLLRLGSRSSLVIGMIGLAAGLSIVGLGSSVLHSFSAWCSQPCCSPGVMLGFSDVVMNVEGAAAERALGRALLPRLHAGLTLGVVLPLWEERRVRKPAGRLRATSSRPAL